MEGVQSFFTIKKVGLICCFHMCRRISLQLHYDVVFLLWCTGSNKELNMSLFVLKGKAFITKLLLGILFLKNSPSIFIIFFLLPLNICWNLMLWWKACFLKSKCYLFFLWHTGLFYWIRRRSWKIPGSFSCLGKY